MRHEKNKNTLITRKSQWSIKETHLRIHSCLCRWTTFSSENWPTTKSLGTRLPCNHSRMLRMTNRRASEKVLRGQSRRGLHPVRRTRWGRRRGLSTPSPRPLAQLRRSDCSRAGALAALPAVSGALSNLYYASAEAQCGQRRSCLQPTRFLSRSEWNPPEKVTNLGAVSKFAPAASWQRVDNNDSIGCKSNYPACPAAEGGLCLKRQRQRHLSGH